jgi:hypothetical protein
MLGIVIEMSNDMMFFDAQIILWQTGIDGQNWFLPLIANSASSVTSIVDYKNVKYLNTL